MKLKKPFTIYTRTTKDGQDVWYMSYYDAHGRRVIRSTGETSKTRAEQIAVKALKDGRGQDPRLEDYAKAFFDWDTSSWVKRQHAKGRPFSKGQAQMRQAHLDMYVLPQFGKRHLAELNPVQIESWLVGLPLANSTKNHILYSFRIVMREAETEGLVARSPVDRVEPMGTAYQARDILTIDELRKLFPASDQKCLDIWRGRKYYTLFLLLATTGCRTGEARALTWDHMLAGGWLYVERAVKEDGSIGPTKGREVRVVALPSRTVGALKTWHAECEWPGRDDLIFGGDSADHPLNKRTFTDCWRIALKNAKIKRGGRNLVVHSLRHGYNTSMRRVLPKEVLQAMVGHKSDAMSDRYDHPDVAARIRFLTDSRKSVEAVMDWNPKKGKEPTKVGGKNEKPTTT